MKPWPWIAIVCALFTLAYADDPTDPEALVAQLGDRSYARREAAQAALARAGKAAGPALLRGRDHPDMEVRSRARALIVHLGIQSDADQALLDAAIARLLDGPPGGREDAARAALAHGTIGRRALAEALVAPPGSVVCTIVGRAWIERGRAWTGTFVFRNTSARSVLLPFDVPAPPRTSWAPFVEDRPAPLGDVIGVGHASSGEAPVRLPVLERALRIAAGASLEVALPATASEAVRGAAVGVTTLRWSQAPTRPFELDRATYAHGVAGTARLAATLDVVVLPKLDLPVGLGGATLEVDLAAVQRPGESIAATLVVANGGGRAVRIDADWPRYTWVALALRDGSAIACRTAMAFGAASRKHDARVALDLAPGATLRYPIEIPAPHDVGTYVLAAEYSNVELGACGDAVAPDRANDSAGYALGRMLAAPREVVAAEPNRLVRLERDLMRLRDQGWEAQRELGKRIDAMGKACAPALSRY